MSLTIILLILLYVSYVNAGPIALGACCASSCLLSFTFYFGCISACASTAGLVNVVPLICAGSVYAPL